jgi:hypothetical protein
MNTGAASLSDEQIEALKAAALAATPQNIDSAQRIERYEDGSFISCPACGGEGNVELNSDFCNYDGEALGVQFYGIGNAHVLAEAYFRAAKPATVLALIERLERAEATPTPQADAAPLTSIKSAYVDWDLVERMRNAEEIDSEEAGMIGAMMDAQAREIDRLLAAIAAGGAQEAVRLTADDADMFWPELDGEQMYHSLDDAVTAVFDDCGADAGDTFTFTCAARLPKVTVRIIEVTENGFEWEEIDLAKEPK